MLNSLNDFSTWVGFGLNLDKTDSMVDSHILLKLCKNASVLAKYSGFTGTNMKIKPSEEHMRHVSVPLVRSYFLYRQPHSLSGPFYVLYKFNLWR